jgi:nitrogenase molybdenum-iron protein alpha/beta subunit
MEMIHMTIDADSFTGAILAVEGIEDAMVVLNGPTGCKMYHSHISDCQYPRASSFDPLNYAAEFYFGQPRVPCTYLDGNDYVAGSTEKLSRILPAIASKNEGTIVIINSPGASLIGDDLLHLISDTGLSHRCFAIENAGYSSALSDGFQDTVLDILKWMGIKKRTSSPGKVNIIGLSLYHSNWDSTIQELKRLLCLLGLEPGSVVCAGTTMQELYRSTEASCNIVVCQEYGQRIAEWYKRTLSIPYVISPEGAPVGFDATVTWLRSIASSMGIDPSNATGFVERERRKQYRKIARFHSLTGLPKGASFAVKADSSIALPLTKWLYTYLGMVPAGIDTSSSSGSKTRDELIAFLERIGFDEAIDNFHISTAVDVVLADGHTVNIMLESGMSRAGVEISLPFSGYVNFLPRTYMGVTGSLFMLEEILNGLRKIP